MKYHSSEIRWFVKEKKELFEIFRSFPGLTINEEIRTDHYLPAESNDLGIKIRGSGGKLEMKWFTGKRESFLINGKETGIIENWIKTGFECGDPVLQEHTESPNSQDAWIKILKIRHKKKFDIIGDNVKAIQKMTDKYADCEVEFTELKINDSAKYFSLGFESLKGKEYSQKYLELTLNFLKSYIKGKCIQPKNSFSYPALINSYEKEIREK